MAHVLLDDVQVRALQHVVGSVGVSKSMNPHSTQTDLGRVALDQIQDGSGAQGRAIARKEQSARWTGWARCKIPLDLSAGPEVDWHRHCVTPAAKADKPNAVGAL